MDTHHPHDDIDAENDLSGAALRFAAIALFAIGIAGIYAVFA